jgi:acyl carrier protein
MTLEQVFEKVREAIADSCGIEQENIHLQSTLFNDLAITSIDLVDILYTLEMAFDIELKISDIEKESRKDLKNAPFEINNIITDEGLEVLKKRLPEIPEEKLRPGLTTFDIINLVNVQILCNMIIYKLQEVSDGQS